MNSLRSHENYTAKNACVDMSPSPHGRIQYVMERVLVQRLARSESCQLPTAGGQERQQQRTHRQVHVDLHVILYASAGRGSCYTLLLKSKAKNGTG